MVRDDDPGAGNRGIPSVFSPGGRSFIFEDYAIGFALFPESSASNIFKMALVLI